jgi:hypothetical protein
MHSDESVVLLACWITGCITQDLAFEDACGKQGVRGPFSMKLKDFGGMLVDTFSSGERTKPPGYFGVRVPIGKYRRRISGKEHRL